MPNSGGNPVKYGITLLPCHGPEFIEWCRCAEASGFDALGIADSQSLYREAFVSATLCAQATERIRCGPLVINPATRHPAVAASASATLAELAPGRVFLGIGTGDSAVHNAGVDPADLAELRAYTTAIRDMQTAGAAEYHGRTAQLDWNPPRVPLYIAASGPKTLQLAGEVADGVVILTGLLPEIVADSIDQVRIGAARAGRTLDKIDLWWLHWAAVGESRAAAIEQIKMSLASGAKHLARFTTAGKHIPDDLEPKIREVKRRYRSCLH